MNVNLIMCFLFHNYVQFPSIAYIQYKHNLDIYINEHYYNKLINEYRVATL